MVKESFLPHPLALTLSRQGNGWSAGDQDEQNRQKADSVSKLSKVKAPITAVHSDDVLRAGGNFARPQNIPIQCQLPEISAIFQLEFSRSFQADLHSNHPQKNALWCASNLVEI